MSGGGERPVRGRCARLVLPERWAADPGRRDGAHVPEAVAFPTKPQVALTLVDRARRWTVPFRDVVADAGYGDNPTFLAGLEERQLWYVCAVERTFGVRLPAEVREAAATAPAPPKGQGRPKLPRAASLQTVEAIAAAQPERDWQTITWREGTKGALSKRFVAVRVHRATGDPAWGEYGRSTSHARITTGNEDWLLAERSVPGEEGDAKYYCSNLPADTSLERLVTVAHARWLVEQFYEDAKGKCGLADYQGRRWDGLHRHLALAMLTYTFLTLQRHAAAVADATTGGFPPLCPALDLPGHPPSDPGLVVPGSRPMAHLHRSGQAVPSPQKLTK